MAGCDFVFIQRGLLSLNGLPLAHVVLHVDAANGVLAASALVDVVPLFQAMITVGLEGISHSAVLSDETADVLPHCWRPMDSGLYGWLDPPKGKSTRLAK